MTKTSLETSPTCMHVHADTCIPITFVLFDARLGAGEAGHSFATLRAYGWHVVPA